ncbi:MAG: BTAD domain-containing putative transcriptional regulator [Pseudomonadota bacterium]
MTVRIELFGGVRVSAMGRPIALPSDFPRAALAFLAAHRGCVFSRDELATRLWPDLDPARGRASVSTALWRMRRIPEIAAIIQAPSRTTLVLPADRSNWVDVDAFTRRLTWLQAARTPDLRRARITAGLWKADPFVDIEGEWAALERARLEALRSEALDLWMRAAHDAVRESETLHAASRLIEAEPFEEAPRALRCQILVRRGSAARARAEHRDFTAFLQDELGVDPEFDPRGMPAQISPASAT